MNEPNPWPGAVNSFVEAARRLVALIEGDGSNADSKQFVAESILRLGGCLRSCSTFARTSIPGRSRTTRQG